MANCNAVKLFSNRQIGNVLSRDKNKYNEYKARGPTTWEKIIAETIFLRRIYTGIRNVREIKIPDTRATFLIVFSSDGTKIASTNGNHDIYVVDVKTKNILKILSGHKRTPWTVAFHPSNNNVLASGCLSGEVRVWNLDDDSCEVWQSPGQTVIASLAFHPKVKLLLIATYKDLYFWDWSTSIIFGQTSTEREEEKIRYVKFDSSGDKLITAIALKSKLLSQFDSISFREVFHFNRERHILKDVRFIEKYCERYISNLQNKQTNYKEPIAKRNIKETIKTSSDELNRNITFDIIDEIMPYMCIYHNDAIHSFLNVDYFCPTKFSHQLIEMFKKNSLPVEYFAEKCYFCRYTWLYCAVFEFQLTNDSKSHICKEFRFMMNDKHVWKFNDMRLKELKRENEDSINGLTEETIRYCFEQYARTKIAPYFSKHLVDGVCSKCSDFSRTEYEYSTQEDTGYVRKPFSHNVSLRSDCFLNVCEMFKFSSSGSFASFMTTFAELYQYLPALQQISTKEDSNVLNSMMTEWEYLYCKLLFINNIVEGDEGLMINKRLMKMANKNTKISSIAKNIDNSSGSSTSSYFKLEQFRKRWINKHDFVEKEKLNELTNNDDPPVSSHNLMTNSITKSDNEENKEKLEKECDLCKEFEKDYKNKNLIALKILRKDCDNFSNGCLRRNDPKIQRRRIEKLYLQQLDFEISRTDGALFRTIQITKKCIRMYMSSLLTELKKLLKYNFTKSTDCKLPFNKILSRLFIFITRRTIIFISNLLEFLSNFKYDINELTEIASIKIFSSPPLFPTIPFRQYRFLDNLSHRRNYTFDINCNDEPVFEEELETISLDLSDDELGPDININFFSKKDHPRYRSYIDEETNSDSLDLLPPRRNNESLILPSRVKVSSNYFRAHLNFLNFIGEEWYHPYNTTDSYQSLLLQNVNSLFNHFQCQSIEETIEYPSSHHPLHRLQMWDFSQLRIPDISIKTKNIVVSECKVHNDATIAISNDDTRVAVLLSPNQYDQPDWVGIFSLEWKTMGHILCAISLNQIAVSLSFSPTDHYLAVGYSFTYNINLKMADIMAVQSEITKWKNFSQSGDCNSAVAASLIDISDSNCTAVLTTVNCIKWIPVPGQGLVFGNSVGEIKFVF